MTHDATLPDEALRATAQRLGGEAAERLDVEVTAAAVLERLKREPRARGRAVAPVWLRSAAALALLISGVLLARAWQGSEPTARVAPLPTGVDLGTLSTPQLEELLASLDQTLNLAVPPASSGEELDQLTPDELRAVLNALEG
jgi:hypothetical protein